MLPSLGSCCPGRSGFEKPVGPQAVDKSQWRIHKPDIQPNGWFRHGIRQQLANKRRSGYRIHRHMTLVRADLASKR